MLRKLFVMTFLTVCVAAIADTSADTLLNASSAKNISIFSSTGYTSITATKLNNSMENFFYETGNKSYGGTSRYRIEYSDVRDVMVCETDTAVNVSFAPASGAQQSYTFSFPDLENRSSKSYLGTKSKDFGFELSRSGGVSWDLISSGLSLGWVGTLNANPDFNASMWKSNELAWRMVIGIKMCYRRTSLALGLGVNWQNFVTKGSLFFNKDESGRIVLQPYADYSTHHRSRIKIFSLTMPLIYSVDFGHSDWGVNFGLILNFNTGGNIKTQYHLGDGKFTHKTSDIGQRPVTLDIYASLQFKSVSVYVKYSPMHKLRTSAQLDFNSVSTGLSIGF